MVDQIVAHNEAKISFYQNVGTMLIGCEASIGQGYWEELEYTIDLDEEEDKQDMPSVRWVVISGHKNWSQRSLIPLSRTHIDRADLLAMCTSTLIGIFNGMHRKNHSERINMCPDYY